MLRAFLRHVAWRDEHPCPPSIVLVGSTAGTFGEAGHADYASAKAALQVGLLLDPPAHETLGQVPHLGCTLATVTFGFFAVMLAKDLRARSRKWPYLIAWTVLALIGFAHFYLGRASISGLLAGLTLGVGWLALVGIAYRQRSLPRRHPGFLTAGFCLIFLVSAAWQADTRFAPTLEDSRVPQPAIEVAMDDWWNEDWRILRDRRSRLGRESVQRFDLQIAAPLEQLRAELGAARYGASRYDNLCRSARAKSAFARQARELRLRDVAERAGCSVSPIAPRDGNSPTSDRASRG